MRKLIRTTAAAVALAAALVIVPGPASAIGYEDSLDDCSYPQSFDVFVMRPLSFTAMLAGSMLLVGSAPIWAAFDAPRRRHDRAQPGGRAGAVRVRPRHRRVRDRPPTTSRSPLRRSIPPK